MWCWSTAATGKSCIDKVPSTPGSTAAIVAGIESLARQAGIKPADIDVFIHGFTHRHHTRG
jgi:hypothetical protein